MKHIKIFVTLLGLVTLFGTAIQSHAASTNARTNGQITFYTTDSSTTSPTDSSGSEPSSSTEPTSTTPSSETGTKDSNTGTKESTQETTTTKEETSKGGNTGNSSSLSGNKQTTFFETVKNRILPKMADRTNRIFILLGLGILLLSGFLFHKTKKNKIA